MRRWEYMDVVYAALQVLAVAYAAILVGAVLYLAPTPAVIFIGIL